MHMRDQMPLLNACAVLAGLSAQLLHVQNQSRLEVTAARSEAEQLQVCAHRLTASSHRSLFVAQRHIDMVCCACPSLPERNKHHGLASGFCLLMLMLSSTISSQPP
jgi:hypothetical protein